MIILKGLRVTEISGDGSAAMAAKHLADWGADVTVLEPPQGTPLRHEPPYYHANGKRESATWAWLSRGKTAVRVGPGTSVSHEQAREACAGADVVLVESAMTPAVLGLQPRAVRSHFAGKTTCVLISAFAPEGAYADYAATDLGINAKGGWMHLLGDPAREPLRPGGELIPKISGLFALVAALVSLRHMRQGGEPQFIDISQQAVAASMTVAPWLVKSMAGVEHGRRGNSWPMGVMQCKDGWVGCPPLTPTHWEMLCQLMGIGDVLDDPQGRDITWRMQHEKELASRVQPWLAERTRQEVFEQAQAYRLPAAPVQTIADRLQCPQLAARHFWQPVEIGGKTVKTPRATCSVRGIEHTDRGPLREADSLAAAAPAVKGGAGTTKPPFEGLRVLDLTAFWSGPYATMMLGALGADVIKIETLMRPDPYRFIWAPAGQENWIERGPLYCDTNCDKRNIALDLNTPEGKQIFEKLVAQSDIVINNFANRVMPNLGFTNERLLEINPQLIAVNMPGYGTGGPWEAYVGYAIAFEQLVVAAMTGYPDGAPSYCGGFNDPMVGLHAVAAIELALRYREETGKGTEVEVPQVETLDSLFAPDQIAVQHGAPVPGRRGNKHDWMAPHDAYSAAGQDEWITIAVSSDAEFAALANVLGRPELATEARFATIEARKQNEAALDAQIAEATRGREPEALERELQAAGVKALRVAKTHLLIDDPNLQQIGFFQTLTRPLTGTHPQKTWPFRFSSIDASHKRPAPLLGEHNAEVIGGLAGVPGEELSRLREQRIIGSTPVPSGQ